MRRTLVGLAVVMAGFVLAVPGAAAATTSWSAAVHGRAPFELQTTKCAFVEQRIDGAEVVRAGTATARLSLDSCVTPAGTGYMMAGTFTLRTARGSTITGTVAATFPLGGVVMSWSGVLTVTGGTGEYAHASGTLSGSGTFAGGQPNPSVARVDLELSGTVST